jgi:hypothetical protein
MSEARFGGRRAAFIDGTAACLKTGAEFQGPMAPRSDGGIADLGVFTDAPGPSGYTAHLMDPWRDEAFFVAFSPELELAFGYRWRRSDFPWMGISEQNHSEVPTYRWLPAKSRIEVQYDVFINHDSP